MFQDDFGKKKISSKDQSNKTFSTKNPQGEKNVIALIQTLKWLSIFTFTRYLSNDNFFGDVPFGETSDGEIMRHEVTLDGTLNDLKADLSRTTMDDDESKLKDKSHSLNQSNLGKYSNFFLKHRYMFTVFMGFVLSRCVQNNILDFE